MLQPIKHSTMVTTMLTVMRTCNICNKETITWTEHYKYFYNNNIFEGKYINYCINCNNDNILICNSKYIFLCTHCKKEKQLKNHIFYANTDFCVLHRLCYDCCLEYDLEY